MFYHVLKLIYQVLRHLIKVSDLIPESEDIHGCDGCHNLLDPALVAAETTTVQLDFQLGTS